MSSFRVRPRFSHTVDLDPEATQSKILEEISPRTHRCEVKSFPGYLCLRIPEEQQHFWSPRLTLSLEPTGENKTSIEGIYGPNANVWSLFLYGYMISGSVALFSACLSLAQVLIDQYAWGLWIFWPSIVVIIALYFTAQFGQKLGAAQTVQLHQAYENTIGKSVEIR